MKTNVQKSDMKTEFEKTNVTNKKITNKEEPAVTINESKVIFLGDGDTGKSYTIRRILNDGIMEEESRPYLTRVTHGIEILDFQVIHDNNRYTIHFWDFGGQQILHSLHRCFLTEQTYYVITVKSRDTRTTSRAKYWLRNLSSFAPSAPVLLFVNCWDYDDGRRTIDERYLLHSFPQIQEVVYCSAKQASEEEFRAKVMLPLFNMIERSDFFQPRINTQWNQLRTSIMNENRSYLSKKEYHQLCNASGIIAENASDLLTFFNNLGVCFSYRTNMHDDGFLDYKLLNPSWLLNALYAIIEEGVVYSQGGKISVDSIYQMLGNTAPQKVRGKEYRRTIPEINYTFEECQYIIDVAERFNLCYHVDENTLFIPALCSNNTPIEYFNNIPVDLSHIEYLLQYDYLPDTVVHQLMISCSRNELTVNTCWLSGMALGVLNIHKVIIRMMNDSELKIDIYSEKDAPAFGLFKLLHNEICAINKRLNLQAHEYIVDGEDRYSVISLLSSMHGAGVVYGSTSGKERKAAQLLGEYDLNNSISDIQISQGVIYIPIRRLEYHRANKNDPALRYALYEAYGRMCPYCSLPITNIRDMQVDHILPVRFDVQPDLEKYVSFLRYSGFDIERPDYIENYFPTHRHCNFEKGSGKRVFPLMAWHEVAARHTPKVLKLIDEYNKDNKE